MCLTFKELEAQCNNAMGGLRVLCFYRETRTKSLWNLIVTVSPATKKLSTVPVSFSIDDTGRDM